MGAPAPRWGWHRLHPAWAAQLVAEARLPPHSLVLDVGAGDGAVTAPLVAAGHRVIAFELHPGRVAALRERFHDGVHVVRADATDLRLPRRPFHVVANPPFSVTTPLLRRLLHPGSRLVTAHLVLQEQAARRWASQPVPAGHRGPYALALGRRLPRRAFDPPPAVDARLLVVRRR